MSDDLSLLMCLSAFAFILGFIAGISLRGNPNDDIPREPLARDVFTPGHKLVAMPTRTIKPSSAWPRTPVQRVQSQVESGLITGADDNAA